MTTSPYAVVVFNPTRMSQAEIRGHIDPVARRHGWATVDYVETTEEDPGFGQAREAVDKGADMVVACGGDGTVRVVAAAVKDSDAALGIIPAGTGNLLARNLTLPMDFDSAAEVAFAGQNDRMDICIATVTREDGTEEEIDFVVMAGVGIDAQMIINTDDDMKKRFGYFAYVVAIIKSLRGGNRIKTLHRMDGGDPVRASVHSVIVGNCGELVGNVALLPDAKANDGILDVVAMRPRDLLGWIQIFARIVGQMGAKLLRKVLRRPGRVTGGDWDLDSLRYFTGTRFEVKLKEPEEFEVDGDHAGKVTSFRVDVDHLGLKVRVTEPAPAEEPGEASADTDLLPGFGMENK